MNAAGWVAVAGGATVALVGLVALAYAWWATQRIDSLHGSFRESFVVAEAGRSEVAKLTAALQEAHAELNAARAANRDEVGALTRELNALREELAAAKSPEAIRRGLTRPLPSATKTPAPTTPPPATPKPRVG